MQLTSSNNVEVLLPLTFDHGFDYAVPDGLGVRPGDYVRVSFGRREVVGVVWGAGTSNVAPEKIKPVRALLAHLPPMTDAMRRTLDWVAAYTMTPRGLVLKMAMPQPDALKPPKAETLYRLPQTESSSSLKLTPARLRIIAFLKGQPPQTLGIICARAMTTPAVVRGMAKFGALEAVTDVPRVAASAHGAVVPLSSFTFSGAQKTAVEMLRAKASGFHPTLLDGVTGSGKTEVYFELIHDTIRAGKQALVLLPEIALSVQWLARFEKRFGFRPALWHSDVSPAKKRDTWQQIAQGGEGEALVTIGARSALFLPYRNLGLIVVDEEHDHSYKQEEGVIYQARDMAVVRAKEENIPIVLASATPSLETTVNVQQGRYGRVHLPERVGEAQMPTIRLVDMRAEKLPARLFLSTALKNALAQTIASGGQAMLFLNRRGYAPLVLCNDCGHRFQCPQCTTWLVLHQKNTQRLTCHHCGFTQPLPKRCPSCQAEDTLRACGPGVERIAEEVREFFPQARLGVMTSETTDARGELAKLIEGMEQGTTDILIGTQMITKGHHFANLALVGVVDADMSLSGGDLRAGERTYQLLHQLSGRAGRESRHGTVFIQTFMPEHPVMGALLSGDRDAFMNVEGQMREAAGMPPFGRLAAVIVEGPDAAKAEAAAKELARNIPQGIRHLALGTKEGTSSNAQSPMPSPHVLGPAPAPLFKLRGNTRYRFLVKSPRVFNLQSWLHGWLGGIKTPSNIRIKVDIDPYSFL